MDELESLRREMASLKQNLDKQQIINSQLLRCIMKQRASWLNTLVNVEICIIPLTFLTILAISLVFKISAWYAISFLVLGAIDTALDCRTMKIPPKTLGTASIMELRRILIRQKKERFWQMCVATPLGVVWMLFFLHAIFTSSNIWDDSTVNTGGMVGGVIGGIIGAIAVAAIYRKAQRTNNSLLSDLDSDNADEQ